MSAKQFAPRAASGFGTAEVRVSVAEVYAPAKRMVAALERTRRRRRTVRDLMALDDHTLRDIGLHRSEVLYTVWSRDEARRHRS